MAKTGRPRVPTHLKLLRNNPGRRPIKMDAEPQPEKGAPYCPRGIKGDKRKTWNWVRKILDDMGIGTRADLLIIEGLSNQIMTFREAQPMLDSLPATELLLKSEKTGVPYQNPLIWIRNVAWKNIQSILSEIGFTPAARTRIRVRLDDGDEFDPFEAWQKKKKGNVVQRVVKNYKPKT